MTGSEQEIEQSIGSLTTNLLYRVKNNEAAAWDRLVDMYHRLVYWWCRRAGLRPADAQDVSQQVFIRVFKHVSTFRGDGSFIAWLRTITFRETAEWRRRQPHEVGVGVDDVASPGSDSGHHEEVLLLLDAVLNFVRGEFSERDWSAFTETAVQGRSVQEVAAELEMTSNQVYLARSRIRRRIRDEFPRDAHSPGSE